MYFFWVDGINWSPVLCCCMRTHPDMTLCGPAQPGRNATGYTQAQIHTDIRRTSAQPHTERVHKFIHKLRCLPHTHTHTHRYKCHWRKIQTRLGSLLTTPVNTAFAWRMQLMLLGDLLLTHPYTCTQTHGSSLVSIFALENIPYSLCFPLSKILSYNLTPYFTFCLCSTRPWLVKESVYCFSQPLLVSDSPHFCIWLQWSMRLKTFLQSVMN